VAAAWGDGAAEAAALIVKAMPRQKADLIPLVRLRARQLAEFVLGFRDSRPAIDGVVITDDLLAVDLGTATAVEHVHPGLSSDYTDRRRVIAEQWFDQSPRAL
jgi:hypothetical protein